MAPFEQPRVVLSGLKERVECLSVQGDKLYVGTSTGNLHVYKYEDSQGDGEPQAELVETKKALSRRAIEQIAFIKDVNSLAVLSDSLVTLYPLPGFQPPTPLVKTKGALSFAVHTYIEHDDTTGKSPQMVGVPTVVTYFAIGCKRKIVLYSWRDGEPQEPQETTLPHSPRAMVFLNNHTIYFGYSQAQGSTDFASFSLKTSTMSEFTSPISPATSGMAISNMSMGALSGYMTLGLGAKQKPCLVRISDSEVLVAKDNNGLFVGEEGRLARNTRIGWPSPPEELAFVTPYVFSVLPPGSAPALQAEGSTADASSQVLEIRSSISTLAVQTLLFPPPNTSNTSHYAVRLLTPSPSAKSPLFLVTTPADRATATASGSSIWQFRMKPWSTQLDELVEAASYADAIALLATLDQAVLPDKERRQRLFCALHAVAQFRAGHYDDAMDTFIDLDINPAKVIALYPENIAGRLATPPDEWIPLFGGPKTASPPSSLVSTEGSKKEEDTASVMSAESKRKAPSKDRSIETLIRYLSDRRPKVDGALKALNITPAQSHQMPYLSATSLEDILGLPSAPLSALTPEELVRFAQIVDTALFKAYLIVRPALLGPLCRLSNWCEVSEIEELLRARGKYTELIGLYNGKKMHDKALDLLRSLSEKEEDKREKLMPSVTYLQRLGPEHLDQIFRSARWVIDEDADIGFEIFTSEEVQLPQQQVGEYLEKIDPALCARFIEFLIAERGEQPTTFHDWLAELYLRMTVNAQKSGDEESRKKWYSKLLHFIETTDKYRTDRLFGLLPAEDLFEAKAILLGKLGRHDSALEIYVYRLQDFLKAEEYCKRIYAPSSPTSSVFLTLLRTYLRPPSSAPPHLLQPALELIGRHAARLDARAALALLPPLVRAREVKAFLEEAVKAPRFDAKVVRAVSEAREQQVAARLVWLQGRRVRVTDSRICPQCHKRIGHSVIAVHAPRGEVTHYQCREAFSKKLKEMRA